MVDIRPAKSMYEFEYDATKIIEELEELFDIGNLLYIDLTTRYVPITDELLWIVSIGYTSVDGIPRTKEYYVTKKVYERIMRFVKSKIPKK